MGMYICNYSIISYSVLTLASKSRVNMERIFIERDGSVRVNPCAQSPRLKNIWTAFTRRDRFSSRQKTLLLTKQTNKQQAETHRRDASKTSLVEYTLEIHAGK